MTEFKQIVGRGTRVHEDTQKYYFTLLDFRGATSHFADPEFDGEPVQIYEPKADDPVAPPDEEAGSSTPDQEDGNEETTVATPPNISIEDDSDGNGSDKGRPRKYYIRSGQEVAVRLERVEYMDENGKLVTESLRDYSKNALRQHFRSLDEFLKRWNSANRKQAILDELKNEGLLLDPLADELGQQLNPFDLICHVAFDQPALTRRERANNVRKRDIFSQYGFQARTVLETLLEKYQDGAITNLSDTAILKIPPFNTMGTPVQLVKPFGGKEGFEKAAGELQSALYSTAA